MRKILTAANSYKSLLIAGLLVAVGFLWQTDIQAQIFTSPNEPTVETEIELTAGVQRIDLNRSTFSYAFRWETGTFRVGDTSSELEPVVVDNHEDADVIETDEPQYSTLYFANDSNEIYLQGVTATEVTLIEFIPTQRTLSTGATGQINRSSGANYTDLNIVSRSEWGADESLFSWSPKYKAVNRYFIHHTALANNPSDYAATVRSIYYYHAVTRGWGDIGYNYLIAPDGTIFEGRRGGAAAIGAHTYGYNDRSIGISMMGNFQNETPTSDALRSLRQLLADTAYLHGVEHLTWQSNVVGHRDSPQSATLCPGQALYDILPNVISDAETLRAANVDNSITDARAAAVTALEDYQDIRLELVFTEDAVSGNSISNLIPRYSAIIDREIDTPNRSAIITVESIPGYSNWDDDTPQRLILLYTIFSLDENVESVNLVDSNVHPLEIYDFNPDDSEVVAVELVGDLLAKYSGNITKGSGVINIQNVTDSVTHESFTIDSTRAEIHYFRHLNFYPNTPLEDGKVYRVEICEGCIEDYNGNPLPAVSWEFEIELSTFDPIHRFWSPTLATHFYTGRDSEYVSLTTEDRFTRDWDYERVSFYALTGNNCGRGQRVFRFWSPVFQNHFYTIDLREAEALRTEPRFTRFWREEGVTFCAYDYERPGSVPVYRFWSPVYETHFYTISQSEKNTIETRYAGIWEIDRSGRPAFYAMPSATL